MVKRVTIDFDSSKMSVCDCVPLLVLKKYEPELLYMLADLFVICFNESPFPDWESRQSYKRLVTVKIILFALIRC